MDAIELAARLAEELERPRAVTAQVARHLTSTYDLGPEAIGTFLDERLATLEDYEIDLILSSLFTPALDDQARFAPLLEAEGLAPESIDDLISTLARRPTVARLVTDDGATHPSPLRPVTIERYVRRLRLEGSMAPSLHSKLNSVAPAADRGLALAVARRVTWADGGRADLLNRLLDRFAATGEWSASTLMTLLRLAETYEPAGFEDLRARLPGWIEAVRRDAAAATSPKPFFNERVEDLHGGGRDQRRGGDARAAERQAELESLRHLHRLLT